MKEEVLAKGLEIWSLQTLIDTSIALGMLALGLAVIQGYYRSLEKQLSLRVSIELWRVVTVVLVDVCLALVVLVGLVTINADIMVDAKVALPFYPVAVILYAVALMLRLFHGGHGVSSRNFFRSLYLMFVASIVNLLGFALITEAASEEYLEIHPSAFWLYLKTHFRSNGGPAGMELTQITFYVCFPLLLLVLCWGFASAVRQIRGQKDA